MHSDDLQILNLSFGIQVIYSGTNIIDSTGNSNVVSTNGPEADSKLINRLTFFCFRELCKLLGHHDLAEKPKFKNNEDRYGKINQTTITALMSHSLSSNKTNGIST
jgi:hypothetical protein